MTSGLAPQPATPTPLLWNIDDRSGRPSPQDVDANSDDVGDQRAAEQRNHDSEDLGLANTAEIGL